MGQMRVVIEGGIGKLAIKHGESLACALLFTNPDGSVRNQTGAVIEGVIYKANNRKWLWKQTLGTDPYSTTLTRDGAVIVVPQLYLSASEVKSLLTPADYTVEIWELRDGDNPPSRYCGEWQLTVNP